MPPGLDFVNPSASANKRVQGLGDQPYPIRIVVLPGTYHGLNMGDMAMLIVALRRLNGLWPDSQITLLTQETEPFRRILPEIELFPLPLRDACLDRHATLEALKASSLEAIAFGWNGFGRGNFHQPAAARASAQIDLSPPVDPFQDLLTRADLFLMTGCGALNDIWPHNSSRILETFDLAARLGVPTAMVGQGFGPLRDPATLAAAARVLPRLWLISLREGKFSPALLSGLGVENLRVQVTGDDAVELAYRERSPALGAEIGINLRLADYSGITEPIVAGYRDIMTRKARHHGARLLGLPISHFPAESDSRSLRQTFGPLNGHFDDGADLDCPFKIIWRTRECRVVVTASYHAAVFALALGIPAIGLVQSEYYGQKFEGLADLFGPGCAVIDAHRSDAAPALERCFDQLWEQAPALRPGLLAAAVEQVAKSRAAYESLPYLSAAARADGRTAAASGPGGWPHRPENLTLFPPATAPPVYSIAPR